MQKKTLSLVGLGVVPSQHLTEAAARSLREADVCLVLINEFDALRDFLFHQNGVEKKRVVDINDLYQSAAIDSDNYARIMNRVEIELKKNNRVCLAIPGSPRLGVTMTQLFAQKYPNDNVDLQVIEGISSLTTMINDLGLDPLEKGTTVLDVNRLLLFNLRPDPHLNLFLYHVCSVATARTFVDDPTNGNRWDLLQRYLLKIYDDDVNIILIRSAQTGEEKVSMHQFALRDLSQKIDLVDFSTSLFIPGIVYEDYNDEFLKIIANG